MSQDYYSVLEVGKDAPAEEIKSSYRRLAMKWHPDRNPGSAEAEDRFKRVSEAYAVLSDPEKRSLYDRGGYASGSVPGGSPSGGSQGFDFGFGPFGFGPFGFQARPFTAEEAEAIFMAEMEFLATELAARGHGWEAVAGELVRRGCPPARAETLARGTEVKVRALLRQRRKQALVSSAVQVPLGGLLFLSMIGAGPLGYLLGLLGLGLALSSVYNLVKLLYQTLTDRAPG